MCSLWGVDHAMRSGASPRFFYIFVEFFGLDLRSSEGAFVKAHDDLVVADKNARYPLTQFAGDGLPAHGHALRHCYRDVALLAGVDEFLVRLLMGHSLRGISQEYVTKAVISSGPSLRAAQRAISRRIVTLLGQTQTLTRREQAAPLDVPQAYREATLLPALP
jgi:integrase